MRDRARAPSPRPRQPRIAARPDARRARRRATILQHCEANEFGARTHRVSKPRLEKTERAASRCDVFGVAVHGWFYHPIP
jgi:hypothetical protein